VNHRSSRQYLTGLLLLHTYDLSPPAIWGGPAWVDSDRWDVLAKTPGEVRLNLGAQMSMLRQLLIERFKLTFDREPKELFAGVKLRNIERLPVPAERV
jgi:uncharacterized protein (TIGR03435 family)